MEARVPLGSSSFLPRASRLSSFAHSSVLHSVASLETQIEDLQTEASRLLRALDTQKEAFERERVELAKRVDVLAKDQGEKEREIEALRVKLQGFTDYDEIKRELEIMKVRGVAHPLFFPLRQYADHRGPTYSTLSLQDSTSTKSRADPPSPTSKSVCRIRMRTRRTSSEESRWRTCSWRRTGSFRTKSRR